MLDQLTHIDQNNLPTMVDVSDKKTTVRTATASAIVSFPEDLSLFSDREIHTKKGPVISTSIIAGTLAAKKTADLIPFCHSIALDSCKFEVKNINPHCIEIFCTTKTNATTGVEMEAIVGATIAAATVYDMCKALSHHIVIGPISLVSKSGGKHDYHK
jgi:cyclic pyranopterin phosphate synthase